MTNILCFCKKFRALTNLTTSMIPKCTMMRSMTWIDRNPAQHNTPPDTPRKMETATTTSNQSPDVSGSATETETTVGASHQNHEAQNRLRTTQKLQATICGNDFSSFPVSYDFFYFLQSFYALLCSSCANNRSIALLGKSEVSCLFLLLTYQLPVVYCSLFSPFRVLRMCSSER